MRKTTTGIYYNDNSIKYGEQSDASIIFPDSRIITNLERKELLKNFYSLPVVSTKDDILNITGSGNNLILIGETGSGKTTGLPIILNESNPHNKIIINIPLVSATLSTSAHVSNILVAKTGNIDYTLGGEKIGFRTGRGKSNENTAQITFNTYGLSYVNLVLGHLDNQIKSNPNKTIIFLDEIHEKSEDFVFFLKGVLQLQKIHKDKVIIVGGSATVSDNYLDLLTENFKKSGKNTEILKVEGRKFPLEIIEDNSGDTLKYIKDEYIKGKSVLTFLAGKKEISELKGKLEKNLKGVKIIEIHSEVPKSKLEDAIKNNTEKTIFLATNAARTGITLDISSVVDEGKQKSVYYDEYGVEILTKEDITKDAQTQNAGRAGRKQAGKAVYTGDTKIDDLEVEESPSVERKVLERKILSEILSGVDIEKEAKTGYLFELNTKQLAISIKNLQETGLLTKDKKITDLGFESLKIPVSPFYARILLEAIELGVAKEIIPMIAIMENKGFIKKEFNIKKFSPKLFKDDFSDLQIQKTILDYLYDTEIDNDTLAIFKNIIQAKLPNSGVIDFFKNKKEKEQFYKVIGEDICEEIGLKYQRLDRINETITNLTKYLDKQENYIENNDKNKKNALLKKSLLSGFLHRVCNMKGDKFISEIGEYEASDTSYIEKKDGSMYIGIPFIIAGDGEKDDKYLLSFISEIEAGDISYFENKIYKEYKGNKQKEKTEDFYSPGNKDNFFYIPDSASLKQKQDFIAVSYIAPYILESYIGKNIIENNPNINKYDLLNIIKKVSLKFTNKIDPNNKDKTIESIVNDDFLQVLTNDSDFSKLQSGEKIKKEIITNNSSNFALQVEKAVFLEKYLEKIKVFIEKNKIDGKKVEGDFIKSYIKSLEEKNTYYAKLIIFLKNKKVSDNKEFKNQTKQIKENEEKIRTINKQITWLNDFSKKLEYILEGQDINIFNLNNFVTNAEKIILDPIITNEKIPNDIKKLEGNIKKISSKLSKNSGEEKYIINYLANFLSTDKRKVKNKKNNFNKEVEKFEKKISGIKNKKIIIENLREFYDTIIQLREKIESIKLEQTSNFLSNDYQKIYTKKFLYNTIISILFKGENIDLGEKKEKSINKFVNRIGKNLDLKPSDAMKIYTDIINYNGKDTEIKNIIKDIENRNIKLENEKGTLEKQENSFSKNRAYIINILSEIFEKKFLEKRIVEINNFTSNIHNLSVENFDTNLGNFIRQLGFTNLIENKTFKQINDLGELTEIVENIDLDKNTKIDEKYLEEVKRKIENIILQLKK